ncbi:MAG: HAD hydrolase-like protein [Phenylobacterium sp.]|jgi:2-haloacid dehalogenase|uniref:HAD family hydrolase n=1 Tax=Phenylobacterium sp. TaxID=1871053 RepID=UPI0025D22009|nr:HAD family hydrolase [Phenylobacterium sp.]MCA3708471.1 HAD hydrolase-like protein [Phenylobacterium sp.]
MDFSRYKVLSFDCYGTLIDWETAILDALRRAMATVAAGLDDEALFARFLSAEADIAERAPGKSYPRVLSETYTAVLADFGVVADRDAAADFGNGIGHWRPFPDTAQALRDLRARYELAILSNIDRGSLNTTLRRLPVDFIATYTAEDIGSYKPDTRNFEYLLEGLAALGFHKSQLLHLSVSLFHDHVPARALGIDTCWIRRRPTANGTLASPSQFKGGVQPTYTYDSLEAFVLDHERGL